MFIILAFLALNLSHVPQVYAEEAGYNEALDYFVHRKEQKKAEEKDSSSGEVQEFLPAQYKYFLSLGAGEIFDLGYHSFELGLSFLNGGYFQQSLGLEVVRFSTKDSEEFKAGETADTFGQAFFISHSVQLSSRLFYLSPELSMGVGRVFGEPLEGALIAFKPGFVFSTKWKTGVLFSGHIYYRRHQYFSKNIDGDGVGFSLKVGF